MLNKSKQKPSNKLQIIDKNTYEQLQQEQPTSSSGRIRNAKYKKTRHTFNLLNFLINPKVTSVERRQQKLRRGVGRVVATTIKRRGKTREGGSKKRQSRLKKSILRYRQQKRQQNEELHKTTQQLENLHLTSEEKSSVCEQSEIEICKTISNVHSRRFRPYCDNCTTPKLGQLTEQLLRELDRFQKRAFTQNEIKARAHRRFVVGFRELQNFLRINKVKLVIIAPDCEECIGEAGIDETIASIKTQCQSQEIPYVFSLRRRQLAYSLFKKVPISCVAILDYDGAREIYSNLLLELQEARKAYMALQ